MQQTARHVVRALESLGMNVSERCAFSAYYDPTPLWLVLLVLVVVAITIANLAITGLTRAQQVLLRRGFYFRRPRRSTQARFKFRVDGPDTQQDRIAATT